MDFFDFTSFSSYKPHKRYVTNATNIALNLLKDISDFENESTQFWSQIISRLKQWLEMSLVRMNTHQLIASVLFFWFP